MHIEERISELNETMKALIVVIQTAGFAPAELSATSGAPAAKRTRRTKAEIEADAKDANAKSFGPPVGNDDEGTRYFNQAATGTVFKLEPGVALEVAATEISGVEFLELQKAAEKEASAKVEVEKAARAAQTTTPPAGEFSHADVVKKLTEVATKLGKESLLGLLTHFKVGKVAELQPLGRNAEVMAHADKLLSPAKPAEPDVADLF